MKIDARQVLWRVVDMSALEMLPTSPSSSSTTLPFVASPSSAENKIKKIWAAVKQIFHKGFFYKNISDRKSGSNRAFDGFVPLKLIALEMLPKQLKTKQFVNVSITTLKQRFFSRKAFSNSVIIYLRNVFRRMFWKYLPNFENYQ